MSKKMKKQAGLCYTCGALLPESPWSNIDEIQYHDSKEHYFCSEECVDLSYDFEQR